MKIVYPTVIILLRDHSYKSLVPLRGDSPSETRLVRSRKPRLDEQQSDIFFRRAQKTETQRAGFRRIIFSGRLGLYRSPYLLVPFKRAFRDGLVACSMLGCNYKKTREEDRCDQRYAPQHTCCIPMRSRPVVTAGVPAFIYSRASFPSLSTRAHRDDCNCISRVIKTNDTRAL